MSAAKFLIGESVSYQADQMFESPGLECTIIALGWSWNFTEITINNCEDWSYSSEYPPRSNLFGLWVGTCQYNLCYKIASSSKFVVCLWDLQPPRVTKAYKKARFLSRLWPSSLRYSMIQIPLEENIFTGREPLKNILPGTVSGNKKYYFNLFEDLGFTHYLV